MAHIFAQNTILSAVADLKTHVVFVVKGGKNHTIHLAVQQINITGGTSFPSNFR